MLGSNQHRHCAGGAATLAITPTNRALQLPCAIVQHVPAPAGVSNYRNGTKSSRHLTSRHKQHRVAAIQSAAEQTCLPASCPCCGSMQWHSDGCSTSGRTASATWMPHMHAQRSGRMHVRLQAHAGKLFSMREQQHSDSDAGPSHITRVQRTGVEGFLSDADSSEDSRKGVAARSRSSSAARSKPIFSYAPAESNKIRTSWLKLMRWSKVFRTRNEVASPIDATNKVVVFGGGSFGTAMGAALALQKPDLQVVLLLRDPYLCRDINQHHCNTRYLKDFNLPTNVRATTCSVEAIQGAQYAVHAVPVQSSRAFLVSIKDILPTNVPIISVSKGLEVGTGLMMSELVPSALGRKQPAAFLSGPSFAREVMEVRPTGVVAACKDVKLGRTVQALFASQTMRVNFTSDVVGVEICGALKNVLAIAAGIVEGLDLGHNAMAALIAQGCAEIRWLSEKMGAKPSTVLGLSGLGDIMLTCYGNLSRNRSVGIRLGKGEKLEDILASSTQVAEGVATAGVVVSLARKYRVSLPVLTAVAQVLDNALTPSEAVHHIMNLPQIEES